MTQCKAVQGRAGQGRAEQWSEVWCDIKKKLDTANK